MNYSLDKLMKQVRGVSYSKNDASLTFKEGFVPVLRAGNIQNSRIIHDDFVYIPKGGVKNVQLLKKGDVLIAASSGSISIVGKAAMILQDINAGFGAFCKVLRPNKEIVNEDYFKFYFETPHYKNTISQLAEGANINNLKTEHFDNLEIYLPPLPQQQKIANILDAADALRQNDKALIAKYDEFTQALFLDMFGDPVSNPKGWEKVKFSEVGKLDRGKSKHRPRNAPELLGGKYPLIQTGDIANSGGYITNYKSTYSEIGLLQSKLWKSGTLCITIAANIAKTGILTFDACFPDSVVGFIPNELTNNEYTQYWMSFLQKIIEDAAPESAQKNINLAILKDLDFPLPPIDLQNQFAERVAVIEEQKAIAQKSIEHSESLFNSLLQKAFKGEL
jgi:type I restriction enzyme S subunit